MTVIGIGDLVVSGTLFLGLHRLGFPCCPSSLQA